jgi:SagB-type dehydrogenase family enzyme
MRVSWSTTLDRSLREVREERLYELYHENSKLQPLLAAELAETFAVSPFELYLASRGFKQFRDSPRVRLPASGPRRNELTRVLARRRSARELSSPVALDDLAVVLREALEPTALVETDQGATQALRPWPSAGGLYPLDTYVIAASVTGIERGLYHHNLLTGELELLTARSPELILRDGFFWQEFIVESAVVVLLVAVFERTIAKYGERGYRLVLLDAGHAAQNILLVAEQLGLGACAIAGFADDTLADDLGLDGLDEAVVHAVVLGGRSD